MNLIIVGGGTAGWLTALYAKKIFQNDNIILVENEEIGILGAGEGSTPHLIDILNFLNIKIGDVINSTNGTIKNGIKFTNWTKNNSYYYHNFYSEEHNFLYDPWVENFKDLIYPLGFNNQSTPNEFIFLNKLSEQNKVPFIKTRSMPIDILTNPMSGYDSITSYALHFDANLLMKFLKKEGQNRGIIVKEGLIKKIFHPKNFHKFNKDWKLDGFESE